MCHFGFEQGQSGARNSGTRFTRNFKKIDDIEMVKKTIRDQIARTNNTVYKTGGYCYIQLCQVSNK